jgi:hypothetical protein
MEPLLELLRLLIQLLLVQLLVVLYNSLSPCCTTIVAVLYNHCRWWIWYRL